MELNRDLVDRLISNLEFESLNDMQETMIRESLHHQNIILHAPTGSGKTAAYLLAVLHQLDPRKYEVQALIVVPSRELAIQIEQVFRKMNSGYKVSCCYGGHPIKTELNNFKEPPAIVIGTPGRIADHLRRNSFRTEELLTIVLDEFDKSLELGFSQEIQEITTCLKYAEKKILTSATGNVIIPEFLQIKDPIVLNYPYGESKVKLIAVRAQKNDKLESLQRLISFLKGESTLVFCNHRNAVDRISDLLKNGGIIHEVFHGGLEQEIRERTLIKFRNRSLKILITTDLAARGLDIPEIKNIIHYQLPLKKENFIHRNGRTARMNKEGVVWLVLSESEFLPPYIDDIREVEIPYSQSKGFDEPEWITLYFGGGKKNKISKADIVGLLTKKGGLGKEEIGDINIRDYSSFAAVKREKSKKVISLIKDLKMKGKVFKIAVSD